MTPEMQPGDRVARELRAADVIAAAVALAAAAVTVVGVRADPFVTACLVIALIPWALIVARRPLPLAVFTPIALAPLVAIVLADGIDGSLFIATAVATRVASRTDSRAAVVATTVAAIGLGFLGPLSGHEPNVGSVYFAFGDLFGVLCGSQVRRIVRLTRDLGVAERRLDAAVIDAERRGLARDVHDLVAHSLTVVVLHIGGARRLLRSDVGAAEAALLDAERVGRESLDGVREVVGLLRDDAPREPAMDVAGLIETYRAAGVRIDPVVADLDGLPLVQRVTAARVLRESLANAARYGAPGAPVSVRIAVDGEALAVRVANRRVPGTGRVGGFGLQGLREQVTAAGGSLTGGPEQDDWLVRCRLPLPARVDGSGESTPEPADDASMPRAV